MSLKAWFLSWFHKGEPIDAAPGSAALYVAGPISIGRDGDTFTVRQSCGTDAKGRPLERAWSFASVDAMRKQLEEFGGASTAPELAAALAPLGELDLTPAPSVELEAAPIVPLPSLGGP